MLSFIAFNSDPELHMVLDQAAGVIDHSAWENLESVQ